MTIATWLSLLAICCLGAMSPGPSLAVVLKQTVGNGRTHGVAAAWFHAMGVGLWAFATVSGLAILVTQSEALFTTITWGGAGYLIWIAISALRTGGSDSLKVQQALPVPVLSAGIEGAMISLLNPKLAVFFIALFSQFVSAEASVADQGIMIATATLVDGLWYTVVALVLSHGPVLGALQRKSLWINRLTGVVLIGLALRVVTL